MYNVDRIFCDYDSFVHSFDTAIQAIYSAIILYVISWAKLGSAQSGSQHIKLDLKLIV